MEIPEKKIRLPASIPAQQKHLPHKRNVFVFFFKQMARKSTYQWPSKCSNERARERQEERERNETPLMMMMTTVPVTSGNHIDYQCLWIIDSVVLQKRMFFSVCLFFQRVTITKYWINPVSLIPFCPMDRSILSLLQKEFGKKVEVVFVFDGIPILQDEMLGQQIK